MRHKCFVASLGRLALLTICSATVVQAQTDYDTIFNMPLSDLLKMKITSSTLTDKTLQTVPASATVFARQQLDVMAADYLHELMSFVPGFQVQRPARGSDSYAMSARGRRSGEIPREILVLVDGRRVNRGFDDNPASILMMSLDQIEKVEFIRGPGSAIYGSNAFTGVINITTRKDTNELIVNGGSHAYQQAQVFSTAKQGDYTLDVYANGYRDNGDELFLQRGTSTQRVDSHDPRRGYDLNVRLADSDSDSQLTLEQGQRHAEEFYTFEAVSDRYNKLLNRYSALEYRQQHQIDAALEVNYSLGYSVSSVETRAVIIPPVVTGVQEEQSYAFDLNSNWSVDRQRSVQSGISYRHIDNDQLDLETAFGSFPLTKDGSRDIYGVYSQYQQALTAATELTLGARFDKYSQVGTALSPRAALTHQLDNVQTIKLLYGEAFRAPNFNETDLQAPSVVLGDSHINPETIATWELVWLGNWQHHSLSVTWFDSKVDDAIGQITLGPALRRYANNTATEHSQGIELEYTWQLSNDWELHATYTTLTSLPDSALREADQLGSLIIDYQQARWNWNLAANYVAEREMLVGNAGATRTLASYWLLSSKLQYHFAKGYSVYMQGKNLLDDNYLTAPQGSAFTNGIANRGRELSVGVHWKF